jgi:hypothetical protein
MMQRPCRCTRRQQPELKSCNANIAIAACTLQCRSSDAHMSLEHRTKIHLECVWDK